MGKVFYIKDYITFEEKSQEKAPNLNWSFKIKNPAGLPERIDCIPFFGIHYQCAVA